ncbi:unnamed protein product, partial [Closterium sp. NIES-54]
MSQNSSHYECLTFLLAGSAPPPTTFAPSFSSLPASSQAHIHSYPNSRSISSLFLSTQLLSFPGDMGGGGGTEGHGHGAAGEPAHVPPGPLPGPHMLASTHGTHMPAGTHGPHMPAGTHGPHMPAGTHGPHMPAGTHGPHIPAGTHRPWVPTGSGVFPHRPPTHSLPLTPSSSLSPGSRRICIGNNFALTEGKVVLAHILRHKPVPVPQQYEGVADNIS